MDSIFKKLQFKNQGRVLLLNSPEEFSAHVEAMAGLTEIHQQILAGNKYRFVLIFVKSSNDILEYFKFLNENLEEDPFLWFAYPKKIFKKI